MRRTRGGVLHRGVAQGPYHKHCAEPAAMLRPVYVYQNRTSNDLTPSVISFDDAIIDQI